MRSGKVLIAEDDLMTLEMMVDDFTDAGYEVLSYENGSKVVEMAVKHQPDLIILDLVMPYVNGYTIAGQLKGRSETDHIPVVIVSGKKGVKEESRKSSRFDIVLNCVERLEKPLNMDYLLKRVDKYIIAGRVIKALSKVKKKFENL